MGVGKMGEGVVVVVRTVGVSHSWATAVALADVLPQKFQAFSRIVVESV